MNELEIRERLDKMADIQSQLDAINLEKQALVDSILTPEIRRQLADIDVEFSEKARVASENRMILEADIKAAVKELGTSVKGQFLHAVFAKGRVSWDTKGLDGYVVAHPELSQFRKEGEPSVSLRAAK